MAPSTHILQRPAQFQWDSDSSPCKPTNCNCTSVAMVAGFYKDKHYSPTYARKLMQGGSNVCGGTSNNEAVRGLNALGVPASTAWLTTTQVKTKIEAGIPVILTVNYGKIPNIRAYQTDFNFNGLHAVVACDAGTSKDHLGRIVPGIWVRDPDHGSPARPERPDKTFWPDWVWGPAFRWPGRTTGITVYPKSRKVVITPVPDPQPYVHLVEVTADNLRLRDDPSTIAKVLGQVDSGYRFTSALLKLKGGAYVANGVTRHDWLGFNRSGNMVWVARAYTKVIK